MDKDVNIENIRAAREITVALIDKALIPFTEDEFLKPELMASKIGSIYKGIYDSIKKVNDR